MILDWKKNKKHALKKGIQIYHSDGIECLCFSVPDTVVIENITFRNFPYLCIEEHQILYCTFENCERVDLRSLYEFQGLTFDKVKRLNIGCKQLSCSTFKDADTVTVEKITYSYLAKFSFDERA